MYTITPYPLQQKNNSDQKNYIYVLEDKNNFAGRGNKGKG